MTPGLENLRAFGKLVLREAEPRYPVDAEVGGVWPELPGVERLQVLF